MRSLLFILALIVLPIVKSYARLTPELYREQVRGYSWSIKSAESDVEYYVDKVAFDKVSMLPKLSMSGRFTNSFREPLYGGERWNFALEPQIVQTLYGGGVNRANLDQAQIYSDVARQNAQYTQLEVDYAADYAFWNLWAMIRYYDARDKYVKIIRDELRVIKRRYTEGYVSKGDLLMIESRLSEAEYSLASAAQNKELAYQNLNVLRGEDPTEEVVIADVNPDSMSVPRRLPLDDVIQRRPDYSALCLTELASKSATQAVKGGYNPRVYGGVSGSWRSNTPNFTGATRVDGAVFVEMSVPIFHFGERRRAVAVSEASERRSAINSSILLDKIIKDEGNAWVNVMESRAQMRSAARSLKIASENLDISTYAYNEGEVSIVELMQAQLSWIQIYTNAIDSGYNYQVSIAYYNLTVGGGILD